MLFPWLLLALAAQRPAAVDGDLADLAASHPNRELRASTMPACARYRTEVRYGAYGYDHLVHLRNRCARAIACVIRTNVRTKPLSVEVAPESSTTVVTYRGSPARRFEARVWCWKQRVEGDATRGQRGFATLRNAISW